MPSTNSKALFRAELMRVSKSRGVYIALGSAFALALLTLLAPQQAATHGLQSAISSTALISLPLLIWSAQYGASHYENNSIQRLKFLAGSKEKTLALRSLVALAITAAMTLVHFALCLAMEASFAVIGSQYFTWYGVLVRQDLMAVVMLFWFVAIGFATGLITRNRAAAIGGLLGLMLVPQTVLVLVAQNLAGYMPMALVAAFIAGPDAQVPNGPDYPIVCSILATSLVIFVALGWLRSLDRETRRMDKLD